MDLGTDEFVDLAEIGRGGFGVVYRAYQPAFDRTVAIKVITTLNADTRGRFDRERRALGALSHHPNIPAVHAWGLTPSGFPYLAMDYLGRSLADRIEVGPLDLDDALHIGIRVAGALRDVVSECRDSKSIHAVRFE